MNNPTPVSGGRVRTWLFLCVAFLSWTGASAQWPAYRHDAQRSGVSPEPLPPSLHLQWVAELAHPPQAAWPLPGEETPRMHPDRAFHVVADAARIYFGSSVDHRVYALNASDGSTAWEFCSEGPVRYAPALDSGRVYFGSDDGLVYCLEAGSGELMWKRRLSAASEHVVGNGRMISLWPVRTGVAVQDGVVYAAAGVFPYEGLYVCALDAATGSERWRNDTAGDLAWGLDYGGISPQGYMLVGEETVYVPSGRSMPALFDRNTGDFQRFLAAGGKIGGAWALVTDEGLIAGVNNQGDPAKVVYDPKTGQRQGDLFATLAGLDLIQTPETTYVLTEEGIEAIDRGLYRRQKEELPALAKRKTELASASRDLTRELRRVRDEISDLESSGLTPEKLSEAKAKQAELLARIETTGTEITELTAKQKETERSAARWSLQRPGLECLILAGDTLLAGGQGRLLAIAARTGELAGDHRVEGTVLGIAAANGRVWASSDAGPIYCFGAKPVQTPARRKQQIDPAVFARAPGDAAALSARLAEVQKAGYALLLGAGDGRLAYELAQRSELQLVVLERDETRLRAAREHLQRAGVYGRVMVVPWELEELPDYFANLVVGVEPNLAQHWAAAEIARVLRPFGGLALFGPDAASSGSALADWWKAAGGPELEPAAGLSGWRQARRGPLEGAGTWTSLYGNTANTGSSEDQLVRGPLGVLWYGEPGSEAMPDRHARSVSPLAINGRLFVQGEEVLMAYDNFNGTKLWERQISGAVRVRVDVDGSNLSATGEHLFVAAHDQAYRLDAQTGETTKTYSAPSSASGDPRRWGYIVAAADALYGSAALPLDHEYDYLWHALTREGQWRPEDSLPDELRDTLRELKRDYPTPDRRARDYFKRSVLKWYPMAKFPGWAPDHKPGIPDSTMMISDAMFAYDPEGGQMKWKYEGGRIPHISITEAEGTLFFVEDLPGEADRETAAADLARWIADGRYLAHDEQKLEQRDIRKLVALDGRTGQVKWSRLVDLSGCGANKLGTAYADGRLLCFGHYSNHDQTAFAEGGLAWRRISVFDARTGELIWSKPLNYRRRPLIVGDTIYIEPRACSLASGEIRMRDHPSTGERVPWEFLRPGHSCGIVTASPHTLFYRSYCAAFVDIENDAGMSLFGALRPGCWNNLIPANGLLNFQEASAGCTCSYGLRSTVVLTHKPQKAPGEWSVFISNNALTPVKHLALNLGAPGDMRAPDGTLWFAYPRPATSVGQGPYKDYGVKFTLNEKILDGMGSFCRDFRGLQWEGTDKPWLFSSGIRGLTHCRARLLDGQAPATYTVRVGFLAAEGDRPGQRVFDLKLQGTPVLEQFDVCEAAGGPGVALVKEFTGIRVSDFLNVDLVPRGSAPDQAPVVHFLEIVRE